MSKFSLNIKESKTNISAIDIPPIIKIDDSEKTEIYNKIHNKDLLNFYNTLLNSKPNFNFSYMYNNTKGLKISPIIIRRYKFLGRKTTAHYSCMKNIIKYTKQLKDKVLPHELMHMASTIKRHEDNSIFSGFSQITNLGNYKVIGRAINEGYTQLLAERYFDIDYKSYALEVLVASKLEDIIGKTNMENMYFEADLKGLLKELSKYEKEESIMYFLYCLDCLETLYCKVSIGDEIGKLKKMYSFIVIFLIDIKTKKIFNTKNNLEEARLELKSYSKNFVCNIMNNGEKLPLIDLYSISKIYYKYAKKLENFYNVKVK